MTLGTASKTAEAAGLYPLLMEQRIFPASRAAHFELLLNHTYHLPLTNVNWE